MNMDEEYDEVGEVGEISARKRAPPTPHVGRDELLQHIQVLQSDIERQVKLYAEKRFGIEREQYKKRIVDLERKVATLQQFIRDNRKRSAGECA